MKITKTKFFFILLSIITLLILPNSSNLIFALNQETNQETILAKIQEKGEPTHQAGSLPKVDPTIAKWQLAPDQEEFAKTNGLVYSQGKISVYVYLDNESSIPKLSSVINVTATDGNIAVVKATSDEITNLAKLDFVVRISAPNMARPLQIVTRVPPGQDNTAILILVPAIIITLLILWLALRHRKHKSTSIKSEQIKGDFGS